MSDESIEPAACNNSLVPTLNYINTKISVNLNRSCLQLEELTFTHKKVVNICIVYRLSPGKDFSSENPLFEAVKLATDPDPDKYEYSFYNIGFNLHGHFSLSNGSVFNIWCKYEIICAFL